MGLVGKKRDSVPDRPGSLVPRLNPLSDPRVRLLVQRASLEGDYEAVKELHALVEDLVPPGANLWSWWLDSIEALAQVGDGDRALFVKFTREVAGIKPWGEPPPTGRDRLAELSHRP